MKSKTLKYYALISTCLLLFFFFFIILLAVVALVDSTQGNPVNDPNIITLKNYAKLFSDIYYFDVLTIATCIGLYTTFTGLIMGYPLAYHIARIRSKNLRTLMLMAVLSPMLIGIVIRTYAWMTLLPDQGVIDSTLKNLGLITGLKLMYNEFTSSRPLWY